MSSFLHYLTVCDKKYKYILAILAVFSALLSSWAWYPGCVSADVMAQYLQAIGATPMHDLHPPIFPWFWWLEMKIFRTPNLLNATWIFLSAIGLYLFLRWKPCILSVLIFLAIFFSPIFFGLSGFLWKDLAISWILLICAALLLSLDRSCKDCLFIQLLISILLLFCCLLRTNGTFVSVPLFVATWWGWRFDLKRLLFCLLFVAVSLPIVGFINHKILGAENDHNERSLQTFDLAGIAFYSTHETYDPAIERSTETYRQLFTNWQNSSQEEKLSACYDPRLWDSFGSWNLVGYEYFSGGGWNKWGNIWINGNFFGKDEIAQFFCPRFGQTLWDDLEVNGNHQWKQAIKNHPRAYLKHRFNHFFTTYLGPLDGLPMQGNYYPAAYTGYFALGKNDALYGQFLSQSWLATKYVQLGNYYPHVWTNYGLLFFASAFGLFIATFRQNGRGNITVNLLSFAALCYFLGYLVVGISSDWRYIMPTAILVIASCLIWYIYGTIGTSLSRKFAWGIWGLLILVCSFI